MSCKFILGSQSPRRKELLSHLNISFQVESPQFDEERVLESNPKKRCERLANNKFENLIELKKKLGEDKNICVLTADTIVDLDGVVIEKPTNLENAKNMLLSLSGKDHLVHTGVHIFFSSEDVKFQVQWVSTTHVTFDHIDPRTMEIYLNTGESLDKSGAYGIQGMALSFIHSIKGSFSNVMGLPIEKIRTVFADKLGYEWRNYFHAK
ncbi:MAG: Maf family protein [Bacteriovoracaceae bacterium]|nr:Maf family protein [Bacteriovoracaceae bacterium]